jgi:hypothetical protein
MLVDRSIRSVLPTQAQSTGSLLLLTVPSIFDLFRALYSASKASSTSPRAYLDMLFSNDCQHLSTEMKKLLEGLNLKDTTALERVNETVERLKVSGEVQFRAAVVRQTFISMASVPRFTLARARIIKKTSHTLHYSVLMGLLRPAMRNGFLHASRLLNRFARTSRQRRHSGR